MTQYWVYHFRGVFMESFLTKTEAQQWINKQEIPSEFYIDEVHPV